MYIPGKGCHAVVPIFIQVREGLSPQLTLHWQLPDLMPPPACKSSLLLPAAGQGKAESLQRHLRFCCGHHVFRGCCMSKGRPPLYLTHLLSTSLL